MTREEVKKGLMILTEYDLANTPDFTEEKAKRKITAWYFFLEAYSYEQFMIAIMSHIKRSRFFPTISEIINSMPVPEKYAIPETIYQTYMTGTDDPLIIETFRQSGYTKHQLKLMDQSVIETMVKPRIEKIYRELIEKDRQAESINQIIKIADGMKLLK